MQPTKRKVVEASCRRLWVLSSTKRRLLVDGDASGLRQSRPEERIGEVGGQIPEERKRGRVKVNPLRNHSDVPCIHFTLR